MSLAPYESLNLGDHVADAADAVATNRRRFAAALDARPVFLEQVHGWQVATLDADTPDGTRADACVCTDRGVACTIMVADCLPVLFTDLQGRAVAAAHAGWRGLAGQEGAGVIEAAFGALQSALGPRGDSAAAPVMAWLGPCIGPDAFEVGPEVRVAFCEGDGAAHAVFRPHAQGKWLADLAGLARRRLLALGVERIYGNDSTVEWCTVSNPSRFFSHRRDRVSGRFAASIWLA